MLCNKTPYGNEHVDKLVTLSMQNCKPEHLERLISAYRVSSETINNREENRDKRNPDNRVGWQTSFGSKISTGQIPFNFETRRRLLLSMYKGIIRNPNIDISQMIKFIDYPLDFEENDSVAKKFFSEQFVELQAALDSGECAFTIEELIEGTQNYIGIKTQELQEGLANARKIKKANLTLEEIAQGCIGTVKDNPGKATEVMDAQTRLYGQTITNDKIYGDD